VSDSSPCAFFILREARYSDGGKELVINGRNLTVRGMTDGALLIIKQLKQLAQKKS